MATPALPSVAPALTQPVPPMTPRGRGAAAEAGFFRIEIDADTVQAIDPASEVLRAAQVPAGALS